MQQPQKQSKEAYYRYFSLGSESTLYQIIKVIMVDKMDMRMGNAVIYRHLRFFTKDTLKRFIHWFKHWFYPILIIGQQYGQYCR